jgi:sterol desaturase/sphingolipid hydroxylase (fatty acid hydroxylase superfamily)
MVVTALFLLVALSERLRSLQAVPAPVLRPHIGSDVAWYAATLGANLLVAVAFRPSLERLAWSPVADQVAHLPAVLLLPLAVALHDLVAFLIHRALHRYAPLWALHKVHHSSLHLDWLATTRAHVAEQLVRNLPAQGVLFALGVPLPIVAWTLVIYAAFALVGHANLSVGGRSLERVLVTPCSHRRHHAPSTSQTNFGTILAIWDRAFGTFSEEDPTGDRPRIGVPGEIDSYPQQFTSALAQPLRDLRTRLRTRPGASVR